MTWHSSLPPRDDHEAPPWLTATEFKGEQEVAVIKMRQLAKPMRLSRKTVVYSGTGISTAVISQAAVSGQKQARVYKASVGRLHLDRFTDTMKIDMKNKCADVFASAFGVAPEKVGTDSKSENKKARA